MSGVIVVYSVVLKVMVRVQFAEFVAVGVGIVSSTLVVSPFSRLSLTFVLLGLLAGFVTVGVGIVPSTLYVSPFN